MNSPTFAGVMLSLATAVFWAISPMFWAAAGRRAGSFPVLLMRSLLAVSMLLAMLPFYLLVSGSIPAAPSAKQILWLWVSGFTGMAVGDLFIYEAFVLLGPRRTTQAIVLAPVSSVLLAWVWLGEALTLRTMAGTTLVLAATSYAVVGGRRPADEESREPGRVSPAGVFFAAAGAVCVGIGAVAGRRAFAAGPLDGFVATVVRVASAAAFLWLTPPAIRGAGRTLGLMRDPYLRSRILLGTINGPVVGMICYVYALKYVGAGLVSTVSSTSPLFILPIIAWRYRVRIGPDVIFAAVVACAGVALISLR